MERAQKQICYVLPMNLNNELPFPPTKWFNLLSCCCHLLFPKHPPTGSTLHDNSSSKESHCSYICASERMCFSFRKDNISSYLQGTTLSPHIIPAERRFCWLCLTAPRQDKPSAGDSRLVFTCCMVRAVSVSHHFSLWIWHKSGLQ